jgi:hypothetical protein
MPEISRFFNHVDGDRVYNADEFAEYFRQVLTSGIFNGGTNLQVSCNGTDRISRINPGKAWLEGYFYKNTDDPLQLTHAESHGGYDRIDRVILRLDKNTENRYVKAFIKTGIPDVAPVPPELTRDEFVYEISLAQVLIIHNTSVIAANKVTDERLNTAVCGLVNSLIQVDTTAMQAQFDGFIETLAGQGYIPQSEKGEPGGVAEQDAFALHVADNTKHIPCVPTTHSGNAYSVTVPGITEFEDGDPICVKFDAASTGPITVNPNGLGAKAVVDYFGNPVTNVREGLIANLRYDSATGNFQFLGKGGGGNAIASHLLENDTATVDLGPIIGTMPNKEDSNTVITPNPDSEQAIAQGYYGGALTDGKVAKGYPLDADVQLSKITGNSYRTPFYCQSYNLINIPYTSDTVLRISFNGKYGFFRSGASGYYIVVDFENETVLWIKAISAFPAGISTICCIDNYGNFYISSTDGKIYKYNTSGINVATSGSVISTNIRSMEFAEGEELFIIIGTASNNVRKINPSTLEVISTGSPAVTPSGNLWCCKDHLLFSCSISGITSWGKVARSNLTLTSSFDNSNLPGSFTAIDYLGNHILVFQHQYDGRLYLCNTTNGWVAGDYLYSATSTGQPVGTGFVSPVGIGVLCMDNDYKYDCSMFYGSPNTTAASTNWPSKGIFRHYFNINAWAISVSLDGSQNQVRRHRLYQTIQKFNFE